jgi:hypothetical protein
VAVLVIRGEQFAALQLDYDLRWYEGQIADLYPFFAASFRSALRWPSRQGSTDRLSWAQMETSTCS